jgi:hypothetical protein
VNALPENKIGSVMERLQSTNGCHSFMACHLEWPKSSYQIDFSASTALDYDPVFGYLCEVSGTDVVWPGSLAGRSIREIIECVLAQHGLADAGTAALESFVRESFETPWRVDLVAMALPGGGR